LPQRNVASETTANFTFQQSEVFHQNEKKFRRCCDIAPAIEKVGQKSYSWAGEFTAASAMLTTGSLKRRANYSLHTNESKTF
jgi:hypothetical protein